MEIRKKFSVKLLIFYCSLFLYLFWVLKRTVSLSTYKLPMLWLDPHLKNRFFECLHPSRYRRGYSVARRGGGSIIFGTDPVGVGHGRNWPRVV